MHVASTLPVWAIVLAAGALVAAAWLAYARVLVPLSAPRRAVLVALRALALLLVGFILLRPVRVLPPNADRDVVVPIVLDASSSMGIADVEGSRRIDRAAAYVSRHLAPGLSTHVRTEWLLAANGVAPVVEGRVSAQAARSDLAAVLQAVRDRYRDRRLAAIVLVSDGADTTGRDVAAAAQAVGVPVFTVGVGAPAVSRDREVLGVAAGETPIGDALVDLTVTAVSHGFGTDPIALHLLANGRPVDVRRVTPVADGSPVHASFTAAPDADRPTVFTVEIPQAPGELVAENNRRSVLVEPPGRKRRVLFVEGAPGFEHAFIVRALALDPGLEVDVVTRKGRNDAGTDTYLIQAPAARTPSLAGGFPPTRESLFQYDAIVFGHLDAGEVPREQLENAAAFVGERGGGLLVLGMTSFARQGVAGSAIDEVLPVATAGPGSAVVAASQRAGDAGERASVTRAGETHPVTRLGETPAATAKAWAAWPSLAGDDDVGPTRPGAQILAVTTPPGGAARPLVAVQRYGHGRAMVFTGEASWRWRMALPSGDHTYERFWRQAARWLTADAPDPVGMVPPASVVPGSRAPLDVVVRDARFVPVRDADVTLRLTDPSGDVRDLRPMLADAATGRYSVPASFEAPGIYRIEAHASRGGQAIGDSRRWLLVGGADLEMADPRLNEALLRRIAVASGGRYARLGEAGALASAVSEVPAGRAAPVVRDAWQTPWLVGTILLALSIEWTLRRTWGLR